MRRKKTISQKTYKGYMKFPLCGADSVTEFRQTCEYFGDFANPVKRRQIFKRPRQFRVEIHLKIHGANEWNIYELATPNDKLDKFMLSQIMHIYTVDSIKELGEGTNVASEDSFFKVIL